MPILFLHAVFTAGAVCGLLHCCLCLWTAVAFHLRRQQAPRGPFAPPISVLKPLCGIDPHGYDSLRSHCLQNYPDFEIIFGVRDPNDPVLATIRRLIREFPSISIKLVVCPLTSGTNLKISNLMQMLPMASHEYLLINDSDIRVQQNYLEQAIAPLVDPGVGIVTCLYRGIAAATLGSKLEAISIAADFIPGVLCAKAMNGGLDFAMGSTLAFRRSTLGAIGGLESLSDHLADDYELGNRTFKAGLKVKLADCIAEHCLPHYSLAQFFQHQLRWARTIRSARPFGYAGLILTFAIPWSLLGVLISGGTLSSWILFSAAVVLRFAMALFYEIFILDNRRGLRDLWLLPVRDLFALVMWIACYMGRTVVWRGKKFEVANGKLRPA
jgi:ceramide glucosyltransferase